MRNRNRFAVDRRKLLKGTAGLTAGAALGGRAIRSTRAQSFSGSLTAWGVVSFTEAGDELLGEQMRQWGEENGVDVEYSAKPGSDYQTQLATAVEAGSLPDIIMMLGDDTLFYADQDRLVDLTDLYDRLKDLGGGMWPQLLPHVSADGRVYAIPMETDVTVMYARLDLCEQATGERRAPATLDELEEIARAVTEPPTQYGIGICLGRTPDADGNVMEIILADGGTLVDEAGNPAINNPGTISALTRIQRWWNDGLVPPDSTSWDDSSNNTSYQSYQSAFVINPASIFAYLEANDPDLLADTIQAPIPAGSAGAAFPGVGCWSWAVSNESPNVDAAIAMIEAIMQPDMVQAVYEKVGGRWYPVYRDLSQAEFWTSRPVFSEFPNIIESARERWYPAQGTPLLLTQLSAVGQQRLYADMAQDVVVDGMSPEEAAAAAQTRMEQIFAETAE
jgi:multiple sugar transport system substrate-binding protein